MGKMYYYRSGNTQIGPVSIEQMRNAITPSTYVWASGMPYWKQASEVPELMLLFNVADNSHVTIMPPKPNNHLVLSIIAILACQPLGIVAVIMSILSDSSYKRGDYNDAVSKAKLAKILSLIGLISMGAFFVSFILFEILLPVLMLSLSALASIST
ncbi:MAG: CD225/dispanin family protein [Bacteroidales bacterium]|nr:CD225/dispanin family protein [Bacteroidales bacterium]